jgi:antitoxin (DNA-binding transcriptional repressor) of toxin-antitoxin stability system
MKLVQYDDVPGLCDELLDAVKKNGTTFQVMRNGRPMLRIVPVDGETKAKFATERLKRKAKAVSSAALRNDKQQE